MGRSRPSRGRSLARLAPVISASRVAPKMRTTVAPYALHIRLFGPLELSYGDGSTHAPVGHDRLVSLPTSTTARSLLAYLILHHDRPCPRERLIGVFWPDRGTPRARRALSHTLWQIRSALGSAADRLSTEGDTVTFAMQAGDWLDVTAFERCVESHTSRQDNGTSSPHLPGSLSTSLQDLSGSFAKSLEYESCGRHRNRLAS